jgi:hypothetical protein
LVDWAFQDPDLVIRSAVATPPDRHQRHRLCLLVDAVRGSVVDIADAATGNTTGTRLVCAGGTVSALVSASACTFVTGNACSPLATTCATACVANTIYDQSGSNKCGGAPCNLTNATLADRPTVTQSCQNSKICLVFNGTSDCMFNGTSVTAQAQPFTLSSVQNTTSPSGFSALWASTNISLVGSVGANTWSLYAGSAQTNSTAADAAFHAIQTVFNNTSSSAYIDGTANAGLAPGTDGIATDVDIGGGAACAAFYWTGEWLEAGLWGADKTANDATMNTNQHAYWGF